MNLVFYSTTDVFAAEEILQNNNIFTEIEPTPVQDKAYCGVCIHINYEDLNMARQSLSSFEYKEV